MPGSEDRSSSLERPLRQSQLLGLVVATALLATLLGLVGIPNALDRLVEAVPFDFLAPMVLALVTAVTFLGGPPGSMSLTVLAVTVLMFRRKRREAGLVFAATSSSALLFPFLKHAFALPRPSASLAAASGYGFPSGHSLVSTVFWGCLAWVLATRTPPAPWRRAGIVLCLALAVAIGLTRIVLQEHWVTDVVGGWLFGISWLGLALWLERTLAGRATRRESGEIE